MTSNPEAENQPISIRNAYLWNISEILYKQIFGFAVFILMTRFLSPNDFGVVAVALLFSSFASILSEGGFASAIIQKPTLSDADKSTAFWINVTLAVLMLAAGVAASPAIAKYFEEPDLRFIVPLCLLNVVIVSFSSVQIAVNVKNLSFRTLALAGTAGMTAGGLTGVVSAYNGLGALSIVAQTMSSSIITGLLVWFQSKWRPSLTIELESARSLFRFGGFLLLSSILEVFYQRFYTFFLGKHFGTHTLGLFSRADELQLLPAQSITQIVSRVSYPVFSGVQGDIQALSHRFRQAVFATMLINIPLTFCIAFTARELVIVLFGENWIPAAPILQVLALSSTLYPLHVLNLNILKARGRSDVFLFVELLKKSVGLGLLSTGMFFGVMGIATAKCLSSLASFFINSHYSSKETAISATSQLKPLYPLFAISLTSILFSYLVVASLSLETPVLILVAKVTCCVSTITPVYFLLYRKMLNIKA